jgi:lactobin A/cerein 7B family class IIb bacteriocin
LVVGIVALIVCLTVVGGVILGFVAVLIGLTAQARVRRGEATNGGVANAGVALGIVAAVVPLIIVAMLAFGTDLFNEDYQHCIGYHPGDEQACDQYR